MKPKKLKAGKCWGLVFGKELTAADVATEGKDCKPQFAVRTKKEAERWASFYDEADRPRVVRLEVREC